MSQSFDALDADYVLTLEEIANLTEEGSKPADTLMNVVALIATRFKTDVCSAYLLEPDRSNLVLAATLGLHPRCIGTLRLALNEGLAGLVAEQVRPVSVADVKNHPRFKFVKESGEEAYHSFLGVPLIDRGILQGVLVVQTKDSRVFQETEVRMLVEAANQVAPVVSEARTLDRFIAPAQERLWSLARNLWWSWDNDCISLFRDLNPTRWRELNQNPISLLSEIPLAEIERRATELMLHSRINYAYRRQQEYLQADRTWGAANAGVLRPRPVAYFSAEFGLHESLPIYSGGLGVLSGDHIKSASMGTPGDGRQPLVTMAETVPGTDRYAAQVTAGGEGSWRFQVEAWGDPIAHWRHDAGIKVPRGLDVGLMMAEGAILFERAAKSVWPAQSAAAPAAPPGARWSGAARNGRAARAARSGVDGGRGAAARPGHPALGRGGRR